ncbi:hypothetical protein [Viridibacillus arvi]|uniref:ATP-dependent Lon protease n=1 Tax=Viridibacillus arvi TaxID=263475 RepID=A0A0M0LKA8_9BACL|nr:hypothetical protein [Viridibacillus arvi]KOO51500.1 hypothetical protein AMD00_03245 [Viridibacillus arvi]
MKLTLYILMGIITSLIAFLALGNIAIIIGFGIIIGVLIRGLIVLNEVNNRLKRHDFKLDKEKTAKEKYIEERDWDVQ